MNPYESPLWSDYRPWFSGVPGWLKNAAKLAFLVWLPVFICGSVRAVTVFSGSTFNDTAEDFIQCFLGKEVSDLLEQFL